MSLPLRKTHPLIKIANNALIDYPAPINISLLWNFGSLLGLSLVIQIATGLFLAMFYTPDTLTAFDSVIHIARDINYGWLLRFAHANGASLFFICIYMHMARGIYYMSFNLKTTWLSGIVLYLIVMGTAFMGYVLPWGQMSFWGATVITSLLSAIPYFGQTLVYWVWGGFAVDNPTLTRFFALHFLLPFATAALVMIHIVFLHQTGSKTPTNSNSKTNKIPFHPYFTSKDIMGFSIALLFLFSIIMFSPNYLGDPENFIPANPLATPLHIKPEWYFLWLYAILRAIPNKLGGVIFMFAAILIFAIYPLVYKTFKKTLAFYPLSQMIYWFLMVTVLLLTWLGGCPVEAPYEMLGMLMTASYFVLTFFTPLSCKIWDNVMLK